jgi:D-tyrosyl-tRNA(Tyr) deacylase
MRAVIQRVSEAKVTVEGHITGQIGAGMLVFLGVEMEDTETDLEFMLKKIVALRIFSDADGKMNLALPDVGGQMLVVSQFTLLADTKKGNRPSFVKAAPPEQAQQMYEQFVSLVRQRQIHVETGIFAADMKVGLVNDGPVTILLDSRQSS